MMRGVSPPAARSPAPGRPLPAALIATIAAVAACSGGDHRRPLARDVADGAACGVHGCHFDEDASAPVDATTAVDGSPRSVTITRLYTATCDPGTRPQWGFFTYETRTPGDATVVFDARAGEDPAHLGRTHPLVVAGTGVDAPVCAPPCVVDLYAKLGTDARGPALQISVTRVPSSRGELPTVGGFHSSYSCIPA